MEKMSIRNTSIRSAPKIGKGTIVHPAAIIYPNVVIGDNCVIEAYSVIGSAPEHRDYWNKEDYPGVVIGDNCILREFTTVNSGTFRPTQLGNNVVMLRSSHIGHSSIIEDKVNISCNVIVGGDCYIMEGANLGLGAIIHQCHVVGAYSMIGAGAVLPKSKQIEPGNTYVGNPIKFLKINHVGLTRNNITDDKMMALLQRYEELVKK